MPPKTPQLLCSTGPFYMLPLGQVFDVLSRAGFAAAEVMVTSERESQDATTLAAMAGDFGVQIPAIHAPFLLLTRNVFTTDPLEKIRRSVELAHGAGARTVVVHPAYRWQLAYSHWLEAEIAGYNASEEMTVAVENMFPVWVRGRGFTFHRSLGVEDMKKFPAVTLDTSHLAVTGIDIIKAFDELQDRIVHIHLSNNLGTGRDSHSALTQGVLPVGALLQRIGAAGYSGSITLELDVREWASKPAQLASFLRDQRDFCLERLGAPAGT
ncbi:MAG: sugar phosphate isomerase/epimerase family protein [Actinomycetota bacterium]